MEDQKLNPTCIFTGKKDNLQMFAHRNDNGDMVGWLFIHESVDVAQLPEMEWKQSRQAAVSGALPRLTDEQCKSIGVSKTHTEASIDDMRLVERGARAARDWYDKALGNDR